MRDLDELIQEAIFNLKIEGFNLTDDFLLNIHNNIHSYEDLQHLIKSIVSKYRGGN
jgi:hypothetical protein